MAPKTKWGRVATMLYAILGIPLTFLCLFVLGSSLASIFKFIYKYFFYAVYRRWRHLRAYVDSVETLNYDSTVAAAEAVPAIIAAAAAAAQGEKNIGDEDDEAEVMIEDSKRKQGKYLLNSPLLKQSSVGSGIGCVNKEETGQECHIYEKTDVLPRGEAEDKNDKLKTDSLRRSNSYLRSILGRGDDECVERQYLKKCDVTVISSLKDENHLRAEDLDYIEIEKGSKESVCVTPSEKRPLNDNNEAQEDVRVPVFVSLFIFAGYIFVGASLFSSLEKDWDYLIGAYFCFITLSTIGLGDFVPGSSGDSWASEEKQALCSLYLLFGMAMTVMCLKLMQEEVRLLFRNLGRRIGLIEEY